MTRDFHRLKLVVGYLLSLICILALVKVFIDSSQEVEVWNFTPIWLLIVPVGVVIVLFGQVNLVFTWWLQLKNISSSFSFLDSFVIIGLSQLGKYLPGNIAQFLGRIYLVHERLPKIDVLASMIVEALVMAVVALCFAGLWVKIYFLPDFFDFKYGAATFVIALLGLTFVCLYLVRRYGATLFSPSIICTIFSFYAFAFVLHGVAIYLMAKYLFGVVDVDFLACVLGFSFAFVVGYLLPGASGGLGVREYAFVILFAPSFGSAQALGVIVLYRVISVLSDLIFFAVAGYIKALRSRSV